MKRTVILVRHAEPEEKTDDLRDDDRPLTRRGRKQATIIGEFFGLASIKDAEVWTSPLVRARETFEGIQRSWQGFVNKVEKRFLLPYAEPKSVVENITTFIDKSRTLVIIGHQPQIGEILNLLLGTPSDALIITPGTVVFLEFHSEHNKRSRLLSLIPNEFLRR